MIEELLTKATSHDIQHEERGERVIEEGEEKERRKRERESEKGESEEEEKRE